MRTMMKRDDGYALSYVLIVLLVLAAIAMATMSLSVNVMQSQKASIDRMQDRYEAQGMVEQVVALFGKTTLDIATGETLLIKDSNGVDVAKTAVEIITATVTPHNAEESEYSISIDQNADNPLLIKVVARYNTIKVTTQFELEAFYNEPTSDSTDDTATVSDTPDGDGTVTTEPTIAGYTITYRTYSTETIVPSNDEGGADA